MAKQEPVTVGVRQAAAEVTPAVRVQTRTVLSDANGAEKTAAIWADVVEGGFVLQHDYPDLQPLTGWSLTAGGVRYEITEVNGRTLTCAPVEG